LEQALAGCFSKLGVVLESLHQQGLGSLQVRCHGEVPGGIEVGPPQLLFEIRVERQGEFERAFGFVCSTLEQMHASGQHVDLRISRVVPESLFDQSAGLGDSACIELGPGLIEIRGLIVSAREEGKRQQEEQEG
jgi:hypothetical protein